MIWTGKRRPTLVLMILNAILILRSWKNLEHSIFHLTTTHRSWSPRAPGFLIFILKSTFKLKINNNNTVLLYLLEIVATCKPLKCTLRFYWIPLSPALGDSLYSQPGMVMMIIWMEKVAIVDGIKDKDDVDENCLILCKFSFSSISAQRFRRHPLGKSKWYYSIISVNLIITTSNHFLKTSWMSLLWKINFLQFCHTIKNQEHFS